MSKSRRLVLGIRRFHISPEIWWDSWLARSFDGQTWGRKEQRW